MESPTITSDNKLRADARNHILIKGARVHNLKNVDVAIPRHQLCVVTGVSGSGKSSLTMDTLYAEGQRRYVESLSSYARQFLGRMNKPDVDYIKGICPAIAIEQRVSTRTSRSTVGSLTELYDYLRLLFARVGRTYSPISGEEVKKHEVSDAVDFIFSSHKEETIRILYPFKISSQKTAIKELELLMKKGFSRLVIDGELQKIEPLLESGDIHLVNDAAELRVMVDRFIAEDDEDTISRAADSIGTAFFESHGHGVVVVEGKEERTFSNRFELDGMQFDEPNEHFFNFNSPYGACKTCEGFGTIIGIDKDLVFPDHNLSVYEGAIAPWRGEKMKKWLYKLVMTAMEFDFPVHRSYKYLTDEEKELLWTGNKHFKGLNKFFEYVEEKSYKIQYRVMLSRYRGKTKCHDCKGSRLRKEADYVKIQGMSIMDLLMMPISSVVEFFENLQLSEHDAQIAKRILIEIENRLAFMMNVGLGYLTLNRFSNTLSGGETQRIHLTRSLGSNLSQSMYILDEPSIGLHSRDTDRLIQVLKALRDLGNTVVVVEHDEDIMNAADYIIDMGPLAGRLGGEVVYQGPANEIAEFEESLTAAYLNGKMEVPLPDVRRKASRFIEITGASEHNLKGIDVRFPLRSLTVVTGVSGSGKTTLVKGILYPALAREISGHTEKPGKYHELNGDINSISKIELVDQNPIGKSSRSNPVTYIKAYDAIRELYADQQLSKMRGLKPKHFSFNVEGGRCEECLGEGEIVVEMQFLADVRLVCETCDGKRFKEEVLEVQYKDKSIFDVLDLTIDEAIEFFDDEQDIVRKIQPLADVGLGYVKLGQSSSTLSGGEAQRVKLASYLGKGKNMDPVMFIFDEPTTGLHFHDVLKLLQAFDALIEKGHTIIVIEHHLDVIKYADWVIDLGPEGGADGGELVFAGTPEDLVKESRSYTGQYLQSKIAKSSED